MCHPISYGLCVIIDIRRSIESSHFSINIPFFPPEKSLYGRMTFVRFKRVIFLYYDCERAVWARASLAYILRLGTQMWQMCLLVHTVHTLNTTQMHKALHTCRTYWYDILRAAKKYFFVSCNCEIVDWNWQRTYNASLILRSSSIFCFFAFSSLRFLENAHFFAAIFSQDVKLPCIYA